MALLSARFSTYLPFLMIFENFVIAGCYAMIASGITYGVWKSRKTGVNPVVVTIILIFASCALGHGMHGFGMLGFDSWVRFQTAFDLLTVIAAIRFVTYYESFGVLAQIGQIAAANVELESENLSLQEALSKLQQAQSQLIQAEKMTSLGQMVAGIAHEINNPVNFIHGNLKHVERYSADLLDIVALYQAHYPQPVSEIESAAEEVDIEFIQADLPKVLVSMSLGTQRIRRIVLGLRNFSRKDEAVCKAVDIHEGLDSTLLLLQYRLEGKRDRPNITVVRDYGNLPLVECYASQLNQVFLNLLANAIDAIEDADSSHKGGSLKAGQITIRTASSDQNSISITIADNGNGIPEDIRSRVFDPFFTSKEIGKGTGLGLSISYQIVTERHNGKLSCCSIPEEATAFTIQIPTQLSTVQSDTPASKAKVLAS